MSSIFAALEEMVSEVIDDVYAERTNIVRQEAGTIFSSAASSTRQPIEMIGIVDFNPVLATPVDRGQYDGFQPTIAGTRVHVSYDISKFASVEDLPREKDIILFPDRAGGKEYRITRPPEHDGLGRIVCICVPQ